MSDPEMFDPEMRWKYEIRKKSRPLNGSGAPFGDQCKSRSAHPTKSRSPRGIYPTPATVAIGSIIARAAPPAVPPSMMPAMMPAAMPPS